MTSDERKKRMQTIRDAWGFTVKVYKLNPDSLTADMAFLISEIDRRNEVMKILLMRETPDPSHDYRTCSEPSCMLAREILNE